MADFQTLLDGYRRFRSETYNRHRLRYDSLANKGQSPKVMVIACCDSRVDPASIFDTEPGQMFVLRNVANLVPPHDPTSTRYGAASAAIEYAVTQLKVEHIVVLGHARCGGVAASLSGDFGDDDSPANPSYIGRWVGLLKPHREQVLIAYKLSPDMDPQRTLELAAVRQSLHNLHTFPFVAEAVSAGTLQLEGAFFDIADGILRLLNSETDRFEPVKMEWAAA